MPRRLGPVLVALLGGLGCGVHAAVWVGGGPRGRLEVTLHYQGSPERGRFARFHVRLVTRRGVPRALTVVVKTASFTLSSVTLDAAARGPMWFDAVRYPEAEYTARRFLMRARGDLVTGVLRIKGVARPLDVLMSLRRTARGALVLRGRTRVRRLRYRIGTGPWARTRLIGNRVGLAFRVPLVKAGA